MTIIIPIGAGGSDAIARIIGERVSKTWGQPVIVVNKPGAGTMLGTEAVARAKPDGHTLGMAISALTINPAIRASMPYDTTKDIRGVSLLANAAMVGAVHPSVPASNAKEFIAWAKTNKVSFGTWAAGSAAHIVCQQLNKLYDLKMEPVHYRGEGPMWQDMNAGSLQIAMGSYQALRPLLEKDVIRPIAIPGPARAPLLPLASLLLFSFPLPASLRSVMCLIVVKALLH